MCMRMATGNNDWIFYHITVGMCVKFYEKWDIKKVPSHKKKYLWGSQSPVMWNDMTWGHRHKKHGLKIIFAWETRYVNSVLRRVMDAVLKNHNFDGWTWNIFHKLNFYYSLNINSLMRLGNDCNTNVCVFKLIVYYYYRAWRVCRSILSFF